MTTATELADCMKSWNDDMPKSVETLDEVIHELRRIPGLERRLADAEKRALTDEEIDRLNGHAMYLEDGGKITGCGPTQKTMREIVNRLRPQPIAWQDVGDISSAVSGRASLVVYPAQNVAWHWRVISERGVTSWVADTRDAAKASAEDCLRKAVAK